MSTAKAKKVLNDAWQVLGDRNEQHGAPDDVFARAAMMWSAYLGTTVSAQQVAACLVLLKAARASSGQPNRDHWLDMAGYAALAHQLGGGDG